MFGEHYDALVKELAAKRSALRCMDAEVAEAAARAEPLRLLTLHSQYRHQGRAQLEADVQRLIVRRAEWLTRELSKAYGDLLGVPRDDVEDAIHKMVTSRFYTANQAAKRKAAQRLERLAATQTETVRRLDPREEVSN